MTLGLLRNNQEEKLPHWLGLLCSRELYSILFLEGRGSQPARSEDMQEKGEQLPALIRLPGLAMPGLS